MKPKRAKNRPTDPLMHSPHQTKGPLGTGQPYLLNYLLDIQVTIMMHRADGSPRIDSGTGDRNHAYFNQYVIN